MLTWRVPWNSVETCSIHVLSRLILDSSSAVPPPRCAERLSLSVRQDKRKFFS